VYIQYTVVAAGGLILVYLKSRALETRDLGAISCGDITVGVTMNVQQVAAVNAESSWIDFAINRSNK